MKSRPQHRLRDCVRATVERYFEDLSGEETSGVYRMVISEIEKPLLEVVMNHTAGNQSRAAEILGINRNTLRSKLRQYGIIP